VLFGDNGEGKTNLLEAAWMLATLRSFREHRITRLIRHGCSGARIHGVARGTSGLRRMVWMRAPRGRRTLQIDEAPVTDLQVWFSALRAILFSPAHMTIVRGDPTARRQFLDRAAFTLRPRHLEVAQAYRRAKRQKAALLRSGRADRRQMEAWNAQLAAHGARLVHRRHQLLTELSGPFEEMVAAIAGRAEVVGLRLVSNGGPPADEAVIAARLREALHAACADELRRRQVLVGPHRDDLEILLGGRSARSFASQGQARTLVLALKLAELQAARRRGTTPLFLIDDLTSELDQGRMRRLLAVLAELSTRDGQVWITTTERSWIDPLPGSDVAAWRVDGGAAERGVGYPKRRLQS